MVFLQASMARVMCDNTDIEKVQPSMFLLPDRGNQMESCQNIPRLDLEIFKEDSVATTQQQTGDPRRKEYSARAKSSSYQGKLSASFLG